MGTIIDYKELKDAQGIYRLLVYDKALSDNLIQTFSINKKIASELFNIKPINRSMRLEQCFVTVLQNLPKQPIVKDIDVLFNPVYKVDVMKMLVSAYKKEHFSLVWPGNYADGKLTYSEEGYPDYRVYEINDYDIMYVI